MQIEQINHSLVELPEPKTPRSNGLHVSSIIRCIAAESGILAAKWVEELSLVDARKITDPTAILRISMGLAWEEWYIPRLQGVVDHPGEMLIDGVYMTHDGESLDTVFRSGKKKNRLIVHEVKLTYKSTKTVGKDMENEWMWLAQDMAYCKGAGTQFVRQHVLFVNGDYTYPLCPRLKVWDMAFTQDEIDANWELLTSYKLPKER